NDAAAALASARDNRRPVQVVERQSQTSAKRKVYNNNKNKGYEYSLI
ncbi:unnamed protein product, partial [Rotaria magnacalcarata]